LVDENTGRKLYESEAIIQYLCDTYGGGAKPLLTRLPPVNLLLSAAAGFFRPGRGARARPSKAPEKRLELWSFEASPYCRIVRETLCELEIPYVLHNVAKGSPSRPAFVARSKKKMVPYLADPNTGREMFESADIKAYLLEI
jgi:glutathione S-transferase